MSYSLDLTVEQQAGPRQSGGTGDEELTARPYSLKVSFPKRPAVRRQEVRRLQAASSLY